MDACTSDHRDDLADSLPDYPRHVWLRVRAGDAEETAVARGLAVRNQSRRQRDLHTNPIRPEKPAVGGCGHPDRLGHDHLDGCGRMEVRQMGKSGPDPVFRVGLTGDSVATVNHGDELGEAVIRLGLCCMFRDQRQGIGFAFVEIGVEACRKLPYSSIVVLGHPDFYPRFGFSPDIACRLKCPFGSGEAWMALELVPQSLKGVSGTVEFPPPFDMFS